MGRLFNICGVLMMLMLTGVLAASFDLPLDGWTFDENTEGPYITHKDPKYRVKYVWASGRFEITQQFANRQAAKREWKDFGNQDAVKNLLRAKWAAVDRWQYLDGFLSSGFLKISFTGDQLILTRTTVVRSEFKPDAFLKHLDKESKKVLREKFQNGQPKAAADRLRAEKQRTATAAIAALEEKKDPASTAGQSGRERVQQDGKVDAASASIETVSLSTSLLHLHTATKTQHSWGLILLAENLLEIVRQRVLVGLTLKLVAARVREMRGRVQREVEEMKGKLGVQKKGVEVEMEGLQGETVKVVPEAGGDEDEKEE